MASSHVSGLRSVALNIADINAAEDFFVRVWHLSVGDRSGDAVYLRATGTDHHVLSLHKADKTTLRNITFRANSAGESNAGRHAQSTEPPRLTSAEPWQFDNSA